MSHSKSRGMRRALTVLIEREDEEALRTMTRQAGVTADEFICQVIRRTFAEYMARVMQARAAAESDMAALMGESPIHPNAAEQLR